MVLRYDGTFPGLLTAISLAISENLEPKDLRGPGAGQGDLFEEIREVNTDHDVAGRFLREFAKIASLRAVRHLGHAVLSEKDGIGGLAFRYVRLGMQLGFGLERHLADPDVNSLLQWSRRVRYEAHRMKGLLRFRELADGLLYAPMEPDYNILPLLVGHFAARMPKESWMIHDVRRGSGVFCEKGERLSGEVALEGTPEFSEEEAGFQDLWREFFRRIAIPERLSARRQSGNMPKKYWKYLTEMQTGE